MPGKDGPNPYGYGSGFRMILGEEGFVEEGFGYDVPWCFGVRFGNPWILEAVATARNFASEVYGP